MSNLGDFLGNTLGASRDESLGEARGDSRGLLSGACLCDVDEVASVPAAGLWAAGDAGDPAGAFAIMALPALPRGDTFAAWPRAMAAILATPGATEATATSAMFIAAFATVTWVSCATRCLSCCCLR